MSDEYAEKVNEEQSAQLSASSARSFTLLITMHPNNQIELTGPIGNDVLCYGMLEKARAHIQNMHLVEGLKKAMPSNGGINGLLKKMGRG